MRRLLVVLFSILIAAAGVILYLTHRRPSPTPFNWQPYVSILAGNGSPVFRDLSRPTEAGFSDPFGITVATDGTIYISDAGESNRIRKITSDGILATFAGGNEGFADGSPGSFNTPSGLAIDANDSVYVADTSNNRIRKITTEGVVSTIAGDGIAGYLDGSAATAQFNGPVGVAVDANGNVFIADTYNDRIRKITVAGQVVTVAGSARPGHTDGEAANAQFDTPCGIVVSKDGSLIVADTGNGKLRKITPAGQVTTIPVTFAADPSRTWLRSPVGLALTNDGFLYVSELDRGSVVQIAPDGKACVLAGNESGYLEGPGHEARFNHPAGIAIDPRNGDLVVADGANYLIRKLAHNQVSSPDKPASEPLPRLTSETLNEKNLLWPLDPQNKPHEVVATMGEVRGSFDSTDSRDHLHSGLDVFGAYGDNVRAIRSEKVTSPLPNWGFGDLSEGLRVGVFSYIHMHVGRDKEGKTFTDDRFMPLNSAGGGPERIRIRRGTRFRPGEALGTVNRMYHLHLIVGPRGSEINPLSLSPLGFNDTVAPTIEKDGIQLFDETGKRLTEKEHERLIVRGRVSVVVDAFDRTDMNGDRRRLGLYSLGYQVLKGAQNPSSNRPKASQSNPAPAPAPAPGFSSPLVTILFNRLPSDDNATKLVYAAESGITVYGSKTTRFLYQVTNTIRDGHARGGLWDPSVLPKGDYILRIVATDYSGNEAQENRDVLITIK
jgi:sugar lactone lactonase YvrE